MAIMAPCPQVKLKKPVRLTNCRMESIHASNNISSPDAD